MTGTYSRSPEVRVRGRFHPPNSLLGLAIRRRVRDRFRAETWYLLASGVVLAALTSALLAAQSLAGGRVPPSGWLAAGIVLACVFAGFRRGIVFSVDDRHLEVRQGRVRSRVDLRLLRSVELLDPVAYHRREARTEEVPCFVNDYRHRLVRLETDDGVCVLGIPPTADASLTVRLRRTATAAPARDVLAEV